MAPELEIRPAHPSDFARLARMRHELWPETTVEAQREALDRLLDHTRDAAGFPFAVLLAVHKYSGEIAGWVEAGMRSHADGCDPARPTGYLEGWFVAELFRRQGVGAALVQAAEDWARKQGCVEMASDTWLVNDGSIAAHLALGYEEVERVVNFRKAL